MTEHSTDGNRAAPPRDDSDPNALPLAVARERILCSVAPVDGTQTLSLQAARGRIAAAPLDAQTPVPPFRASAMDGYALRHADPGASRTVSGTSLAGHASSDRLAEGACHRITTGARVPDEADTVVQHEDTVPHGDTIQIVDWPTRGLNVRAAGSAGRPGLRLVDAGDRLGSAALAVLAAHGVASVEVVRRVRVGLLSTGDELVDPGEALGAGCIHDANRILLGALLDTPAIELVDLGIVADSPSALRERVQLAHDIDVLVTSGGVSVGEADHVREVLEQDGRIELWKIAMKPGRPLAFGHYGDGRVWFGLPGNPVSAAVTSLFLVRPALQIICGGAASPRPMACPAVLQTRLAKRPGRVEFQRGVCSSRADGSLQVSVVDAQDSHVLRSLQTGNCLIELPASSSGAAMGETVQVLRYLEFGEPTL